MIDLSAPRIEDQFNLLFIIYYFISYYLFFIV